MPSFRLSGESYQELMELPSQYDLMLQVIQMTDSTCVTSYRHKITGESVACPLKVSGGILADVSCPQLMAHFGDILTSIS